MVDASINLATATQTERCLSVCLLGSVDLDDALAIQRRLIFEHLYQPGSAAALLCEHPLSISYGRTGSRLHVRFTDEQLHALECPTKWIARGGGVVLHAPGQLAIYPLLRLDDFQLTPGEYVRRLLNIASKLAQNWGLEAEIDPETAALRIHGRRFAIIGTAIRRGLTQHGLFVNVCPDLEPFREVACDGDPKPMTSLARESPTPIRVPAVRQRVIQLLEEAFGLPRVSVFHSVHGK